MSQSTDSERESSPNPQEPGELSELLRDKTRLTRKIRNLRIHASWERSSEVAELWDTRLKISALELQRCENRRSYIALVTRQGGQMEADAGHDSKLAQHDAIIKGKQREVELLASQFSRLNSDNTSSNEALRKMTVAAFQRFWLRDHGDDRQYKGYGRAQKLLRRMLRRAIVGVSDAVTDTTLDVAFQDWWCPIEGRYVSYFGVRAVHIFPELGGIAGMSAIFGMDNERRSIRNAMLMSRRMEEAFKNCEVCVVPDTDLGSDEAMARWIESDTRDWKFMLVDMCEQKRRRHPVYGVGKSFAELDGQRVQFRTAFQPRARYFYWHYLTTMAKYAQSRPLEERPLQCFFEKTRHKPWITTGRWMGKGMLAYMAAHLGEDFKETLAPNATSDAGFETRAPVGVLEYATRAHIFHTARSDLTGEPEEEFEEYRSDSESDLEEHEDRYYFP